MIKGLRHNDARAILDRWQAKKARVSESAG